ncbi:MAG: hypothetical protein WDM88_07295 [Galbitalea sp.]
MTGHDLVVPLAGGGTATYTNLDYAASTPALAVVVDRVTECFRCTRAFIAEPATRPRSRPAPTSPLRVVVGDFVGARPERRGDLHPQHHGCAEPAGVHRPARPSCSTSSITPTCCRG